MQVILVLFLLFGLIGCSAEPSPSSAYKVPEQIADTQKQSDSLRYIVADRKEVHELNHKLVYRLLTQEEPSPEDAPQKMLEVFQGLDSQNPDFDALFVYFYLGEHLQENYWGGIVRAPSRTDNISIYLEPLERLPSGEFLRMPYPGKLPSFDSSGKILR